MMGAALVTMADSAKTALRKSKTTQQTITERELAYVGE